MAVEVVSKIEPLAVKHIAHNVAVNGVPLLSGYEYADVPFGAEPAGWQWQSNLVTLTGKAGHLIGPGTSNPNTTGVRDVFVRVPDAPETEVIRVGSYELGDL